MCIRDRYNSGWYKCFSACLLIWELNLHFYMKSKSAYVDWNTWIMKTRNQYDRKFTSANINGEITRFLQKMIRSVICSFLKTYARNYTFCVKVISFKRFRSDLWRSNSSTYTFIFLCSIQEFLLFFGIGDICLAIICLSCD